MIAALGLLLCYVSKLLPYTIAVLDFGFWSWDFEHKKKNAISEKMSPHCLRRYQSRVGGSGESRIFLTKPGNAKPFGMQITHSMLVLHAMPHWAPYVNSLAFRREKILCQDDGGSRSSEAGERRKKWPEQSWAQVFRRRRRADTQVRALQIPIFIGA